MKILYPLAKRFIAGYDFTSAKPVIDGLIEDGYQVTVDYVGEMSTTLEDVQKAFKEYTKILDAYSNIDISVKPSQFGLLMDSSNSKNLCATVLSELADYARSTNNTIRLDMEDSRVTFDTVTMAVDYETGCAIQVNHPDTYAYIKTLLDNNIPVRLVKGAYNEPDNVSDLERIHELFILYAALSKDITIATHDESLLDILTDHNQYEFLYGVRRDIQKRLKEEGKVVRIYVPYGENWLPYTLRRLKEWKNLKFVVVNMLKELL